MKCLLIAVISTSARGELKISEAKYLRIHRFLIRRNNIGIISMNNMEENKNMKFKC